MPTNQCINNLNLIVDNCYKQYKSTFLFTIRQYVRYINKKYENKNYLCYKPSLDIDNAYNVSEAYNIPINILNLNITFDINISIGTLMYLRNSNMCKYYFLKDNQINSVLKYHNSTDIERNSENNEIFITDYIDNKSNFIPIVIDGNKRLNYAKKHNETYKYKYLYFPIFFLPTYAYLDLDSFLYSLVFYNLLFYENDYRYRSLLSKSSYYLKFFSYLISCLNHLKNKNTILLP